MKVGDVFPDLHHKMSKKIAQLTKVIYHLNTKNEDRQARVPSVMRVVGSVYISRQRLKGVQQRCTLGM